MPTHARAMRELTGNETRSWNGGQSRKGAGAQTHQQPAYRTKLEPGTRELQIIAAAVSSKNYWISKILQSSNSAPAEMLKELFQSYSDVEKGIFASITDSRHHQNDVEVDIDYMISEEPVRKWETGFTIISQQYLEGDSTPDMFEKILTRILEGVENLERAKERLENKFADELQDCGIDVVVPDSFWEGLEERCRRLGTAFKSLEQKLDDQARN